MLSRLSAAACVALLILGACKNETTIPHTPATIRIVSGSNQAGDLSTALDSALVVQVVDATGKSVSGVALSWTAIGGGTLSASATTTDADGKSSVTWTLSPTPGTQVATVTSAQITGAATSFVATNGATISGSVSVNTTQSPFAPSFSRSASKPAIAAASVATGRPKLMYSRNRIVIGFRDGSLGVAAPGSMAYRSMPTARATATVMRQRLASLTASLPVHGATLSPAILAARLEVDSADRIDEVIAKLQQDPSVAYVERDAIMTVDRVPSSPQRIAAGRAWAASFRAAQANALQAAPGSSPASALAVATRLPNDNLFFLQYWNYNMMNLPRAWSLTTGSAAVTVAVLDMGIRFDDAGIAGNLSSDGYDFVSQTSTLDSDGFVQPSCDGTPVATIDGDGDGPDSDPTDPDDLEDTGTCWAHSQQGDHGLWTAGIIGELGNNTSGGTGINWTVKIRPIRVLGITGVGLSFDIAQGFLYAAGLPAAGPNGTIVQAPTRAPIISASFGGYGSSTVERNAVAAVVNAGSLIIASAGNDGIDLPAYPAAYPGVMAVSALGPDGNIASYSNAGTNISVGAPGGDWRQDYDFNDGDTGGDWVWGRWWDFTKNTAVFAPAIGTSASAPHVSGVAALILAQNPGLTATALRQRIEQFATRPAGASRNDNYGWGVVNAFAALTQQSAPAMNTYVRLVSATTGAIVKTIQASASGSFVFARVAAGSYYLQAGQDDGGDGVIGLPGRRLSWAGTSGAPTSFSSSGNSLTASILVSLPTETEPNDDVQHANVMTVGSWIAGQITTPDTKDVFSVAIPTAGTYTFETSGVVGACGLGLELDTSISVQSAAGTTVGTSDNVTTATGLFCSRVSASLTPGVYYITVTPSTRTGVNFTSARGRYRLEVRSGT